jgi:hypothetical protein
MSNHLIVPSGIQITDWQYDVVEIIDSNDAGLNSIRDRGLLVVYMELRRIRSATRPDFRVSFRRNKNIETFDKARPETYSALPPLGVLVKRYLFFRPVERDPMKVNCKH